MHIIIKHGHTFSFAYSSLSYMLKPELFSAVPNNIIQITLFTALLNLPN